MHQNIPRVLERTKLSFGLIHGRYGGGLSVFIAPTMDDLNFLDEELCGDDTQAVEMQTHLGAYAGVRFPHGHGDTFEQAMGELDSLLETIQVDELEAWGGEVRKAFEALRAAKATGRNCPWWVSKAYSEGRLVAVN